MMWRGEIRQKITPLGPSGTNTVTIAVELDRDGSPGRDSELPAGSRVLIHARDEDTIGGYGEYRRRYLPEQTERDRRERETLEETTRRLGRQLGDEMAWIVREAFGETLPDPGPTELLRRACRDLARARGHLARSEQRELDSIIDRLDLIDRGLP